MLPYLLPLPPLFQSSFSTQIHPEQSLLPLNSEFFFPSPVQEQQLEHTNLYVYKLLFHMGVILGLPT
jgi:hypothetical protein